MPNTPQNLLTYLRVVIGAWREDSREDAELVKRFAESRDESAFAALVYRHGTMVWRTCRRHLNNASDVEDAFQTTFLALTRQAGKFPVKSLSGWLHRVARRTSLDTNAEIQRRQRLEQQAVKQSVADKNVDQAELSKALDEELEGLAERLRVPLILCYLEGRSQDEVARILGCSRTAVRKRMAHGEAILQKRLERRGLALGIGSMAALFGDTGGIPPVSGRLIESTARAAVAFRSGTLAGASAEAAEKLLRSLSWTGARWKGWWVVLACVGALGTGGAGYMAWKMCGNGSDKAVPAVPDTHKTVASEEAVKPRGPRVDCYGDPLPNGALARIGTVRFRPLMGDAYSNGVAFLPDGKTLVSSNDGFLCFWEWATGKELRRSKERLCGTQIAVSPDGKVLATNGGYWDLTSDPPRRLEREELPPWMAERGVGSRRYYSVAFSLDGQTVAWADGFGGLDRDSPKSNLIYLVDASTGKVKKILEDELRPDDKTGGWSLAFSPDNKTLAAGGFSGKTILWDVATGTKRLQIAGNGNWIKFLAFLPDGRTLVESRTDKEVFKGLMQMRFFDAATGAEQPSAETPCALNRFCGKDRIGGMCLSQDGKLLALNEGCAISVWDMATDREVGPAGGPYFTVGRLVFSPDGKKLTTYTIRNMFNACTAQLWDTDTGRLESKRIPATLAPLPGSPDGLPYRVLSLVLSSDGRQQAVAALADGVALVDRATGKEVHRFPLGLRESVAGFSADGRSMLTYQYQPFQLHVWSTVTGKQQMSLSAASSSGHMSPHALSPDGRWLAVASRVGYRQRQAGDTSEAVHLWEVASGMEKENKFETPGSEICRLAWSPDGRLLVGGDEKGTVWLWDVAAGQEVCRFAGHRAGVQALEFSPDWLRLASSSWDTTVLIWDLRCLSLPDVREKDLPTADALWAALGGKDPAAARRSIHLLTRMPDAALSLLRERLRPASAPPDQKRVAMLLTQLDDDNFQVRKQAEEQLEKMGEEIEPALQAALAKKSSPEVRQRIKNVLYKFGPRNLNLVQLRVCRGVEVLERIGTPAARQVLEELSRLPAGLVQAEEAKTALQRLTKPTPALVP